MAYINGKEILFSPKVNITEGATLKTKSITANGTYNASADNADGYSSVTVNVPSSGGGGDIIEVDELPEVGEEGKIYKVNQFSSIGAQIKGDQEEDALGYFFTASGIYPNYYTVKTKPTENIDPLGVYYVTSENDIFMYIGDGWNSVCEAYGYDFIGAVSDVSQMTEDGFYAFIGAYYCGEYKPAGKFISIENGNVERINVTLLVLASAPSEFDGDDYIYYYILDQNKVYSGDGVELTQSDGYVGRIANTSEATEDGIYAVITEWNIYNATADTLMITDRGTYNITNYNNVKVDNVDIIDVTELPVNPNDINANKFYRKDGEIYKYDAEKLVEDSDSILGTWHFNETLDFSTHYTTERGSRIYITFYSATTAYSPSGPDSYFDDYNYISIYYTDYTDYSGWIMCYHWDMDATAYSDGSWCNFHSGDPRRITIYGGNDVTNETFIAWLKANATKKGKWIKYIAEE